MEFHIIILTWVNFNLVNWPARGLLFVPIVITNTTTNVLKTKSNIEHIFFCYRYPLISHTVIYDINRGINRSRGSIGISKDNHETDSNKAQQTVSISWNILNDILLGIYIIMIYIYIQICIPSHLCIYLKWLNSRDDNKLMHWVYRSLG